METKEMDQHIFQAFSALSDAQELLGRVIGDWQSVNTQVNHAKLHLLAIIKADETGWAEAMITMRHICTLPEGGAP